ncbi:MAG: hypothetical protein ABJG41_01445 [Cyclobacteriaceae bacterium]
MITKQFLENRLQGRINKKFKDSENKSHEFFIDQYSVTDTKVTVWCDDTPVDFISLEECNSWINQLREIEGVVRERKPQTNVSLAPRNTAQNKLQLNPKEVEPVYEFHINGSVLKEAKDIMMQTIQKLQSDGGDKFIQQAQAIDGQIQTIIDLAKTEIQLARTQIDLERGSKSPN